MKRPSLDHIPDAWPLLLSQEQVCAYLGIGLETFKKVCPVPPVDMGAHVVRYHRWQIEQWAGALPPRLKQAQGGEHNPPIDKPAPFDGGEAAAEQRRQEALERMRKAQNRKPGRGKAKVRSAG